MVHTRYIPGHLEDYWIAQVTIVALSVMKMGHSDKTSRDDLDVLCTPGECGNAAGIWVLQQISSKTSTCHIVKHDFKSQESGFLGNFTPYSLGSETENRPYARSVAIFAVWEAKYESCHPFDSILGMYSGASYSLDIVYVINVY